MEKLTYHYNDKYIAIKGCTSLYEKEERKTAPTASAIARLAAYEDSGLTPEEVMELAKIVRCRDCKLFKTISGEHWCMRYSFGLRTTDDNFCSYGERKEDEN